MATTKPKKSSKTLPEKKAEPKPVPKVEKVEEHSPKRAANGIEVFVVNNRTYKDWATGIEITPNAPLKADSEEGLPEGVKTAIADGFLAVRKK